MKNSVFARTDLAVEAHSYCGGESGSLAGVSVNEKIVDGFGVTTVEITSDEAAHMLGKPCGNYITVEIDKLISRDPGSFEKGCRVIANQIKQLLNLSGNESVLIAGLGNADVTADSIGPKVLKNIMVTGHMANVSHLFRAVYAFCPGVLGSTGVESAKLIASAVSAVKPDCVIAVDALASGSATRICRTVQIADTGIIPGSGVGNARSALNSALLGVPVIAIGVPTVLDAATLVRDVLERAGAELGDDFYDSIPSFDKSFVLTPREIDGDTNDISKLIGYALNLALHDGIEVSDITMFLG